jgi:hypothetical protein
MAHYRGSIFFLHIHFSALSKDPLHPFTICLRDQQQLTANWCHITVLNVHAPTKEKNDDVKDSFYEGLERVFDKVPKYHTKILLEDFNAKVGREDIFKLTNGKESLHKISNNNGVRLVNFATSKTCDTDHYLMVAKVRERLAVNKQRSHRFHMERFNLKKLNEVEGKEQYRVEVSIGLQLCKIWMQR